MAENIEVHFNIKDEASPTLNALRIALYALSSETKLTPQSIKDKVGSLSGEDIKGIWEALRFQHWESNDMYDVEQGFSMDDWAALIYIELGHRGIYARS